MADLDTTIESQGGITGPVLGGDWGGIMSGAEFLQRITRVALVNNGLLVELDISPGHDGANVGVYNFAEATQADKFL